MGASNFRDMVSGIATQPAFDPKQVTATANGNAIDVSNSAASGSGLSLAFVVNTGAFTLGLDGSNKLTVSVEKSVDSAFSSPIAVPATDVYGAVRGSDVSAWDLELDDASDENNTFKIGVRLNDPSTPFYRLVFTETGTVDGFISAVGVIGPDAQP